MWNRKNEINLRVKVGNDGILSRIASINAKLEELECEVSGLLECIEAEQTPVSGNTEA